MSTFRKMTAAVFIVGILALAFAAGIWLGPRLQKEQDHANPAAPAAKSDDGLGVVTVDADTQSRTGITTTPLQPVTYRPEIAAPGLVMDLQPLFALRARHASATAEANSAEVAAKVSRDEYERNRALFADDRNVSLKALQAAEATCRADEAKHQAALAALREVRAAARLQFGETLGRWAFDSDSNELAKFLSREEVLVRITLPAETKIEIPRDIRIDAPGYPRSSAQLASQTPQSDSTIQGKSYIYRASASLPTGMRIVAQLPSSPKAIEGLLIPETAVIWYGDQPWVFVQDSSQRFVRRLVSGQSSSADGIFVTEGFKPGERIVVTGAQLLHSEVLRPKTAKGPACADPECD